MAKITNKSKAAGFKSQLPADKKKAIMVSVLVLVLVALWSNVFFKKGPQAAQAQSQQNMMADETEEIKFEISYIDLPSVAGRNDVLKRDFFAPDQFKAIGWGASPTDGQNNSINAEDLDQWERQQILQVAKEVKLEAIFAGDNPQVVIDDKLLAVGDEFETVKGGNSYEFEVVQINDNEVVLRCNDVTVNKRIND